MHIIKQIIAQCLLLRAELKEKKAVDLLNQIQSMLFTLESDQLALTSKNLDLTTENVLLKNKILKLEGIH
jgi:cob(I)alamin adenosyltransferase